jgi:hypothetical protein
MEKVRAALEFSDKNPQPQQNAASAGVNTRNKLFTRFLVAQFAQE